MWQNINLLVVTNHYFLMILIETINPLTMNHMRMKR